MTRFEHARIVRILKLQRLITLLSSRGGFAPFPNREGPRNGTFSLSSSPLEEIRALIILLRAHSERPAARVAIIKGVVRDTPYASSHTGLYRDLAT